MTGESPQVPSVALVIQSEASSAYEVQARSHDRAGLRCQSRGGPLRYRGRGAGLAAVKVCVEPFNTPLSTESTTGTERPPAVTSAMRKPGPLPGEPNRGFIGADATHL